MALQTECLLLVPYCSGFENKHQYTFPLGNTGSFLSLSRVTKRLSKEWGLIQGTHRTGRNPGLTPFFMSSHGFFSCSASLCPSLRGLPLLNTQIREPFPLCQMYPSKSSSREEPSGCGGSDILGDCLWWSSLIAESQQLLWVFKDFLRVGWHFAFWVLWQTLRRVG